MNLRGIYTTIRDFLFSNLNKQFLVFMFFLLLSCVFWLIMTLNDTYEREIKLPTRVVGVPRSVVLTSAATDTVRITVRDKGWVIAAYLYGSRLGSLDIPFKNYDKGQGVGAVSSNELKRRVEQQLEISTKLVALKPERIDFSYNNGECKRVPVRWTGRVIPEQLYFLSEVIYSPDSVEIYATREKLDSIHTIYTEPLNYASFRDSLRVECRLSHPANVKVVPERVSILFHTDVLTEETAVNVPVRCINLPPNVVMRTFPGRVKVHYVTGARQLRNIHPEDFVVIADYQEVALSNKEKCNLYLRSVPSGISRATLNTKQVDYVIEEEEEQ